MSQTGKRFLSELMNRVKSVTSSSVSTSRGRAHSLAARRLGMEPLEERQLLAVDPSLLAAASATQQVETSTLTDFAGPIDLSALNSESQVAASAITVNDAGCEEHILSQTTGYETTVADPLFSNAFVSGDGTHVVTTDLSASIYGFSHYNQGWAAALANILTYTGWADTSEVVNPYATEYFNISAEQQTFNYIANSFTNDPSSIYYAFAWFKEGASEYIYQGDTNYAQIYETSTRGGLYPSTTGEWSFYSEYAKEILADDVQSPLYGITQEYLDKNYGVGVEVHYMTTTGGDVTISSTNTTPLKSWLTYWGYDYDATYEPTDVEYYTAVYMSNPTTGEVERMPIQWDATNERYVFTSYDQATGRTPYIYSFTAIQRMPGYGVLELDAYEPNNEGTDFDSGTTANLGKIDVVTPSSQSGSTVYGNTFKLNNLTLFAEGNDKVAADPVDNYKFELTQTASNSDSIVVRWAEGTRTQDLKATLYLCQNNEFVALDPAAFGYVEGHFDAIATQEVVHSTGTDGKIYSRTYNKLTIPLAGLTAGQYFLRVEFADGVVDGINTEYEITVNAGYDDIYEENNSFESVNQKELSSATNPTANLGVLYGTTELTDLVLKQYSNKIDEVDWYRFEMTDVGTVDNYVKMYYNSTSSQVNDADLDLYLYKEDPSDPRGYRLVAKSYAEMTNVETIYFDEDIDGNPFEAGVYYIKVTGNYSSGNVEYKLELNPGVCDVPDLRPEVVGTNNWEAPLVVSSDKYVPNGSEVYGSESVIGIDSAIYLNYSFTVNGASTEYGADKTAEYKGVTLGMYVNGVLVESDDLRTLINDSNLSASLKNQLLALFCDGGLDMKANDKVVITNLNLGRIVDDGSFANKYFDASAQATNAVVIAINPGNYDIEDGFGQVVDKRETQEMSLVYRDGSFYNGATLTPVQKGETVEVYRNNTLYRTVRYGVDNFTFLNDDVILVSVVSHKYEVALDGYYTVHDGVKGELEYVVDNNFSSVFFVLNNLSEDAFAPNASVSDVMNNTNEEQYLPDLGFANIDNLSVYNDEELGDSRLRRVIDNLVITGEKGSNDAYISDWFRFRLKSSAEDAEPNYKDAFVQIDMDESLDGISDYDNLGDLDLYLYKVVQDDATQSFEQAYEDGAYHLELVGSSKGVTATERIKFADVADRIEDGNYFICVSGFNGSANRYSLTLGGFTQSGNIDPTDPSEYFTDDSVTVVNSVATVSWQTPPTDYVSSVKLEYRVKGASSWQEVGTFKPSVTSCKIADLDPSTTYEFRLTVSNHFVSGASATAEKTTDEFLNEVKYRAVIVGVSDYPGTANDLTTAVNDARAFRNALLEDPQWAEGNITYLTDANATRDAVLAAIADVAKVSDNNDVFVFYFAGSGASAVSAGRQLGYLKTCGSTRSEFISNVDLVKAIEAVAAGSKQFFLDAGQINTDAEDTGILYQPFIDSLTTSTTNGGSTIKPQITVLTSGTDSSDNISPTGSTSRSVFNRAVVDAMTEYSKVVTAEEVEKDETGETVESDGRVTFGEILAYMAQDETVEKSGMTYTLASNDTTRDTILMNGKWSESGAFNETWLEQRAIIVTTAADSIDTHDGEISLREAAALVGTTLNLETALENGATFTMKAGSVIMVGVTYGTLVEDVELTYANGGFRTAGACSIQTTTSQVDFSRGGNVVTWSAEDWANEKVQLVDSDEVAVADVAYKLVATESTSTPGTGASSSSSSAGSSSSSSSGASSASGSSSAGSSSASGSSSTDTSSSEATEVVKTVLEDGDILTTAAKGGKEVLVTKVGQNYRLTLDGMPYNRTTGLYLDGKLVTLSTAVSIDQDVVLNKIVFDSSLSGQDLQIKSSASPIVFAKGGVVDATDMKGKLGLVSDGGNALIQASGTDLVALIGLKLTSTNGSVAAVDSGASLEIANSLVYGSTCGSAPLFANEGELALASVTVANNTTSGKLVDGAGTLEMVNTLVALNSGDASNLAGYDYCLVTTDDPGFTDAANNDYTLLKSADAVLDAGKNSACKTKSGVVLTTDLIGNERVSTAGTIDLGAFEYTVADEDRETPSTVVTILTDVVDATDGEISLREAFAYAGTSYQIETELEEGAIATTEDGGSYQVKNGRLVSFDGVSAIQTGQYYAIEGVYLVDAFGEGVALADGDVVTLSDGSKATVSGNRLLRASGIPVQVGATITTKDGATGTLSYGIATNFTRGQQISVALTADLIDASTPVGTFDAGAYILTYQANGTFTATLNVTTTGDNNQSTTTTFDATLKLVSGANFNFLDSEGQAADAGVIVTTRSVELTDGKYTLLENITDAQGAIIYASGAILTLERGVFTDADGNEVAVKRGVTFTSPEGMTVQYLSSNFSPAALEAGAELICADGVTRLYKEGATVYEEVTLGTNITFKRGLENGEVDLVRGPIAVERAVTLDGALNGGLTIDGGGATLFDVDAYREESTSAVVNFNGLTLVNGATGADVEGGFITVAEGSNFRLANSTIAGDGAVVGKGGAIYNAGRTTLESTVKPMTIDNVGATEGGAIYNVGTITINGVEIKYVSGGTGAGLYNAGTATLAGAKINNATASANGGGVYNTGVLSVTKASEITSNVATNGAGLYNTGNVTLVNSTISDNTASVNGGGVYNAGGTTSMTTAKVFGNAAGQYGGAIYDAAKFFATRTVLANNDAPTNGAAVFSSGATTLVSSLVIANGQNSASSAKYSVFVRGGSLQLTGVDVVGNSQGGVGVASGSGKVYNSIVGDNKGTDLSGAATAEYSMIKKSSGSISSTNVAYAPNFADLDTSKDWTVWNLRLSGGSPAVDAGSIDYNYYNSLNGKKTALTVDFAGNARVTDTGVDIGAYASAAVQEDESTVVTTFDDVVDPTDGLVSLREAIRYASTGKTVAERTVTFSPDLFALNDSGVVYLDSNLQTIIVGSTVTVTAAYEDAFGNTKYRDITVDGANSNAPLFMINGDANIEMRGLKFTNGHATGANESGGAFIIHGGTLTLLDAVVTGNTADRNGGAVYQDGGVFYAIDSLFYNNAANQTYGYGGAICITGGQSYVYNTTITKNSAGVYGGVFGLDGLVVLANSIVAQNLGAQNVDLYASNLEATANLIGSMDPWRSVGGYNGNIAGTVTRPQDPAFTDYDANDFTLRAESLALNAGVNAYAFGPDGVRLKYDLNANERIVGGVVDMGAFESSYQDVPSTVVTTLADTIDQTDGLISLREAIEYAKQNNQPITFDLGEEFEGGAEIRLDGTKGAITVDNALTIDASEVPGGVTIVGSDSRIFNVQGGTLTLDSVALTGGMETRGGAIYMTSGELNLTNVLIYGNEADAEGGAIYVVAGAATLLNTTIAGNSAPSVPGAYFGGSLSLQNSIIAGNAKENSTSDENFDLYVAGKLTPIASIVGIATASDAAEFNGYNGNVFGTADSPVDPGFTAGETNDFTLTPESIAVNTGSNRLIGLPGYYASILQTTSNPTVLRTDFAGDPRLVGGTVDVGAFEFQIENEAPSVVVTTLEDVVDPFDNKISLREAIDYAGSMSFVDGVTTPVGRTITFAPELANGVITLAETLEITKCVTIDASDVQGTITLEAGDEFNVLTLNGQADSVASEIVVIGLSITGGVADYGAGVYHVDGTARLYNCVVYGNEGVYGAGVASAADAVLGDASANQLTLVNCTIANNNATGGYAGLWSRGSSVNILNTLIAKNTVNGEAGVDIAVSSIGTIQNSLIGASSNDFAYKYNGANFNLVGTANAPIDPAFNDVENNDFSLVRSEDGKVSVAINGGDNALVVMPSGAVPATDAAANLRIIGSQVDIGAYESPLGPTEIPSLLVTTLEDVVDEYDGLISLREAVQYANNYGLAKTITFAERLSGGTIYLKEALNLSNDITIDGLTNNVVGITLTVADDVNRTLDESREEWEDSVIYVNAGSTVINGLTITNRYTERVRNGAAPKVKEGGAIYVRSGAISLYNTLVKDSAATKGSAIFINPDIDNATVNLVNTTVVSNVGQTTNADEGAAIYGEKGAVNMWNSIVALTKLDNGGTAQDVYKGQMQLTNDTVVERGSTTFILDPYDTSKTYEPTEGATIGVSTNDYLYYFTDLTYSGGVFYRYYGETYQEAYEMANNNIIRVMQEKVLTYDSDWYDEGVIYNLNLQNSDVVEWYSASTGKTTTVRYWFGNFVNATTFRPVTFNRGDTITFDVPLYYIYQDGNFYWLNIANRSFTYGQTVTDATVNAYAQNVLTAIKEELATRTTYDKVVNGVNMTYPIVSADVSISGLTATSSRVQTEGDDTSERYQVVFTYTATYDYVTRAGSSVFNSFVGLSDTLASQTSGNGAYVGSSTLDLSHELDNMFVDPNNGNYTLQDLAIATNAGNNSYINQGTINGTYDALDVLGQPRIHYTTIDMGAFENQNARDAAITSVDGTAVTLTVTTYRDVVDATDGLTSFREAITMAEKMYDLGYSDISINFQSSYDVRVDNTLGGLRISRPMTINANSSVLDADNSGCALAVATDGKVVIRNLVIKNGVNGNGGGINFTNGDLTLDNCLIYDCQATASGGGIYAASNGVLDIYNSTIAKNTSVSGNGIYSTSNAVVNLYNTIVATNRSSVIGALDYDVMFESAPGIYGSLIGNAGTQAYAQTLAKTALVSKIGYGLDNSIDPLFINATGGNFHVSATESPAKNAGSMLYVYDGARDLDGNTLSGRTAVTIGSYQIGTETPSLVVTTLEDIVDTSDGLISLREALLYQRRYFGDCIAAAGAARIWESSYDQVNAMNNASVYSATYYSPITFAPSLAGGTIKLNRGFTFEPGLASIPYDYLIDASSLSGLGGITIDASAVSNNYVFSVEGEWDAQNQIYWPAHLEVRNLRVVGAGSGTAFRANPMGMITMRNCLVEKFGTALTVQDSTDNVTGLAQIYNCTLVGNASVTLGYIHNTIITGSLSSYPVSTNWDGAHMYASLARNTYGSVSRDGDSIVGFTPGDTFVDPANGDYRLADAALANNTGNNTYIRTLEPTHSDAETDLNGNKRVLNTYVDMGCYERPDFIDVPSSTVTTDQDVVDPTDGVISVREAHMYAQQWSSRFGGTVRFSADIAGSTITLNRPIQVTRNVNFDGGSNDITLDGGQNGSVFDINIPGVQANVPNVYLRNMTLTGGKSITDGGAVYIQSANVYLAALDIYGNEARRYGGAVYAYDSELTIADCRIGGNTATYYGGVVNEFGKTVMTRSYVAQNVGLNANAGADIWGKAAVNFVNSKNNVVGYVADNIQLYDGIDNNRVGTAEVPLKPFYAPAVGNLEVLPEYVINAGAVLDEAFADYDGDETTDLSIDYGPELDVFAELFDEEF